jgi:hypothetical protein
LLLLLNALCNSSDADRATARPGWIDRTRPSRSLPHSACHPEGLSGDPGRLDGGQEGDGRNDVTRDAETAERLARDAHPPLLAVETPRAETDFDLLTPEPVYPVVSLTLG